MMLKSTRRIYGRGENSVSVLSTGDESGLYRGADYRIMAALVWANGVDKKDATQDAMIMAHAEDDKKTEKRVDKLETETDDRLARMEAKLDRLIERSKH